jgi:cell division protein FtsW
VFGYLGAIAFVGIGGLTLIKGYRSLRITGFIQPLTHCKVNQPGNPCYQELEGRYAIANGGWFGVGLGQGHLKWGRLPNAHNDFIFAVIGEELGVVGCFIVLALLATLAYTGLRIARRVSDPFRRIVATGIIAWLVGQAAINIGGVIGLIPITGLPLPFISDGGSALVVVLGAVGVLASFARAEPDAARALHARPAGQWVRIFWAPLPALPRSDNERSGNERSGNERSDGPDREPGRKAGRGSGRDSGRAFDQDFDRGFDRDSGRDPGRDSGRKGRDSGRDAGRRWRLSNRSGPGSGAAPDTVPENEPGRRSARPVRGREPAATQRRS